MSHYLQISEDLEITFHCDSPPFAPCRCGSPKWEEEGYPDDWDELGRKCWAVEWVEDFGLHDAIKAETVLGRIPVYLFYDDGVVLEPFTYGEDENAH